MSVRAVGCRGFLGGRHQNGILTPPQNVSAFAAFDVVSADRGGLVDRLLQDCATTVDTAAHALRDTARTTCGGMQNVVWARGAQNGEPSWVDGGSYHVVRIIRMLVEFWDRSSLRGQERLVGRRKNTGAPFTGVSETDVPDLIHLVHDTSAAARPLSSQLRLASRRLPGWADRRMLLRLYNYDNGVDANGNLDMVLPLRRLRPGPRASARGGAEGSRPRTPHRPHLAHRRRLLLHGARRAHARGAPRQQALRVRLHRPI